MAEEIALALTDQLAADGVILLRRLCSEEFVRHVLKVSLERSSEVRAALGSREIGIGSAAGYEEIVQRSPGRWDVPISPQQFGFDDRELPWWSLVTEVLGADAEHSFSGVVFSEAGSPAQYWHIDSPHESANHLPPHALNVLVALQDIPMNMGPTEFARGSHTLTNHLSNAALVRDELIYQHACTSPRWLVRDSGNTEPESFVCALERRSCLLFDDRILHRGLANQSDRTRHVAYFSYRKRGYAENTHFESQRSVFATTR